MIPRDVVNCVGAVAAEATEVATPTIARLHTTSRSSEASRVSVRGFARCRSAPAVNCIVRRAVTSFRSHPCSSSSAAALRVRAGSLLVAPRPASHRAPLVDSRPRTEPAWRRASGEQIGRPPLTSRQPSRSAATQQPDAARNNRSRHLSPQSGYSLTQRRRLDVPHHAS